MKDHEKYTTFFVPKKNGGKREINAPIPELKSLQRRAAQLLAICISDAGTLTGLQNKASHGFMPGKSILTNSSPHKNKQYVFNIDLKNFFPTISGKRIRGLLMKDRKLQLPAIVATTLAHIACRNGVLPQGSPCSPILSNLICGILDTHLSRLANDCGCSYSRYADDITFSTNKKVFPADIAEIDPANPHKWLAGKKLSTIIAQSGFFINNTKTRMQYKKSRQVVTGLIVNKRINVPAEYRHLVRAYLFSLITHGKFDVRSSTKDESGNTIHVSATGTPEQLHGMLGFIHSVDSVIHSDQKKHPENYPSQRNDPKRPTGNFAIYRRFLLYTRFYANTLPLLVCEGKTDNVYIGAAVHQLRDSFPQLVMPDQKSGKQVLSFKFLKYARRHRKKHHIYMPNFSTASILGAGSGGSANIAGLLQPYKSDYAKFKEPKKPSHPVIIVVDDDSGGKVVFDRIKKIYSIEIDRSQPFTRFFSNMYVVPVVIPGQPETSIEQLFSKKDLDKGFDGKPFDFSKDANPTTSSGKEALAYRVVAKCVFHGT